MGADLLAVSVADLLAVSVADLLTVADADLWARGDGGVILTAWWATKGP